MGSEKITQNENYVCDFKVKYFYMIFKLEHKRKLKKAYDCKMLIQEIEDNELILNWNG